MVGSSLAPKWPILVLFCGIDHQKSNFSLISAPFLSGAVEASGCYFFENWLMKLKCPLLLKQLGTIIQKNVDLSTPQSHLVSLVSLWDTLYNVDNDEKKDYQEWFFIKLHFRLKKDHNAQGVSLNTYELKKCISYWDKTFFCICGLSYGVMYPSYCTHFELRYIFTTHLIFSNSLVNRI